MPAPAAHPVAEEDLAGAAGPAKLAGLTKFDLELRDMVVRLKLRQVALREKEGALVQATEVRASWAALVLNAKSRLLQMGDQVAEELAYESDPIRCRRIAGSFPKGPSLCSSPKRAWHPRMNAHSPFRTSALV